MEVSGNLNRWDAGGGAWGEGVVSTAFIIGSSHISVVNLTTHVMTVTDNGRLLYTWPISAGQLRWPTMDGTHVVLDRQSVVHMISSTVGIPVKSPAGYNEFVYWDVHISDSGEYVHAAPWDVSIQGIDNVSHGCVNLSPARADAFFHFSRVGDIVEIVDGVRPPLQGDHGVMDWSFGAGVTWTPAKVTQLRTSVTTIPVTTLPPPPGAPTRHGADLATSHHHNGDAHHHDDRSAPDHDDNRGHGCPAPSTTLVAPTTAQPAHTTTKSVVTTPAKPALRYDAPVATTTKVAPTTARPLPPTTRPATPTTRVVPTTARPAPTTTKPPLTTTTKPAPTTTRPPLTTTTARPDDHDRPYYDAAATTSTRPATTTTRPTTTTTRPTTTTTRPTTTTTRPQRRQRPTTTTTPASFDNHVDGADDLDGPPDDHEHLQYDLDYGGRRDHDDRVSSSAAVT